MKHRLTAAEIHPSIFVAIKEVASATLTDPSGGTLSVYSHPAYSKWTTAWFREYGVASLLWFLAVIPIIAGTIAVRSEFGKGAAAFTLTTGIALWLGAAFLLHRKTQSQATWAEIEAIRPILKISENQNLYLDCVKAVLDSKVLEESQKGSWLASLNASLDQALQLDKLHLEMQETIGASSVKELEEERVRIQQRMESATDPSSKEIFRESLEMAEDRLNRSDGMAGQVERAEAHLELTRQTFIKTRETLRGLEIGSRQSTQIDLEPLRANLARVQVEAHAIRSAIDEIAQLRAEL